MGTWVRTAEETHRLVQVARGERGADLALMNATMLNVYTGELLENYSVCIADKWIAYAGEDPDGAIREETQVIDVDGKTIIPGFIDAHMHLAWLSTPHAFLQHAIAGGTTTIITETLEPYPVAGLSGILDFLDSIKDQPVKIFATAPPMVSISRAVNGIQLEDLKRVLNHDDVLGLGESYWQAVHQQPDVFLPILHEALRSGKTLEGHTAGASGRKLMGYLATGISSCHEPIQPEEVLERLRLGLYVMVREGSIRRDLEALAGIKDLEVDLRRLILVSDGLTPGELLEKGYMEHIVQKAIDYGFPPVDAIRMATLNPAEHFHLDHLLGGIAPGRYADLVIIPDIRNIKADCVIGSGRIVSKGGSLLIPPRKHTFSKESVNSVRLTQKLQPEHFKIQVPAGLKEARVRIIDMITDLVTRELVLDVPIENGDIRTDTQQDILKISAVDRTVSPGKMFTGLIRGFGLTSGALACSAAWDTSDIIVVGATEPDMAVAVNRVVELQGGAVLCSKGEILRELALPVFGIMSDRALEEIDVKMKAIAEGAAKLGVPFRDPVLTLVTLTGAAIPFLRICEEGLVNLKDGKTLGLFRTAS